MLLGDARVDPSADNNHTIQCASVCGHTETVKLLLADLRVSTTWKKR